MFDKNLVHALIGRKDLDCGSAELSVNLRLAIDALTSGHGSLSSTYNTAGLAAVGP
jgi:hypothetical protein